MTGTQHSWHPAVLSHAKGNISKHVYNTRNAEHQECGTYTTPGTVPTCISVIYTQAVLDMRVTLAPQFFSAAHLCLASCHV